MFERNEETEKRLGSLFVMATRDQDAAAMDEVMGYALPALIKRVTYWCDRKKYSRGFSEIVACAALMKALDAAEQFDPDKPLMSWLTAIARHEFIDLLRVEQRFDRCRSVDGMADGLTQDDDGLNKARRRETLTPLGELVRRTEDDCHEQQRRLLVSAIRNLPAQKRRVVELYRAGHSVGAIAVMLNVPAARVSKILFDAKAELHRRIG